MREDFPEASEHCQYVKLDINDEDQDFLPQKRPYPTSEGTSGIPQKRSNPVVDRLVRNMLEDQKGALDDDFSQYF